MTNIGIFGVIIYKFCLWYKFSLIILFEVNNNLKVDYYNAILAFKLIIRL